MFKIYLRLLTFVRPIGKYAVPYFIYSILHALFNTVNYIMLIPIIQAMFDPEFRFEPLYVRPEFAFDEASLSAWLRYAYTSVFGEYNPMYVLILLATVVVLLVCRWNSAFLYRPIRELLDQAYDVFGRREQNQDEFDYLTSSVTRAAQNQKDMQKLVQAQRRGQPRGHPQHDAGVRHPALCLLPAPRAQHCL